MTTGVYCTISKIVCGCPVSQGQTPILSLVSQEINVIITIVQREQQTFLKLNCDIKKLTTGIAWPKKLALYHHSSKWQLFYA